MKRTSLLLLAALLCMGGSLFAQPSVSVKKGKVSVNGTKPDAGWHLKPILEKIGSEYRLYDGYNRVYTYDQYGLALFEKKNEEAGSNELLEIQLFFAPGDANNVSPKNVYTGQVFVEKLRISSNLASQNLLSKLKKYKQTDSYTEHNYRLAYKGLYIYFLFSDTEQSLKKMSIGPDRR